MKPRLIVVKWHDAHYASEEVEAEDAHKRHKDAIYYTGGILVKSDETGVTVAQDFGLPVEETDKYSFRTRTFIPRSLVEEEFDVGPVIRSKRSPRVKKASPHPPPNNSNPSGE